MQQPLVHLIKFCQSLFEKKRIEIFRVKRS
jgi:hypothetical protein